MGPNGLGMDKDTKDDYLWDRSGEPDPEVRKLETMLEKLRHSRPAPEFPVIVQPSARPWRVAPLWLRFAVPAIAALLMVAGALRLLVKPKPVPVAQAGWDVVRVEGAPRLGNQTITAAAAAGKLAIGEVLETDAVSKAGINDRATGEVLVEPDTRLRLLASNSAVKRLALERGTIRATIWAPPGEFVVDTPSAVAVDLGCVYTLHVDGDGNGELHTSLGWVGFKFGERESFIPAGAMSRSKKNSGPGTPYFEDASQSFRAALSTLDFEETGSSPRAAAFSTVLKSARRRDAFTLWHLLSRVALHERGPLFDRLAALVPAPAGVTRDGVLNLDRQMLDLWWNELGLGDISLWRNYERSWSIGRTPAR